MKKNGLSIYAKFSGIALQMGVIIFVGAFAGNYIDKKFSFEKKWFTMILTLASVAIALYLVLSQVIQMSKESEKEQEAEQNDNSKQN